MRAILSDIVPVAGAERISAARACGRILAEDAVAPRDVPPFPASAMDGYAFRSSDAPTTASELRLCGTSRAGHPFSGLIPPRGCIRILTGAPVPEGLDVVAIQEDCTVHDTSVRINTTVTAGDNVRHAGHDATRGQRLITAGTALSEFHLGWLAACGITELVVRVRPKVALLSTGDELREPGSALAPGQIHDANRHALRALLERLPVIIEDYGIVPDDPEATRQVLERAARGNDLIIASGGVSVGDADWVRSVIERIGELQIWKLNLKPGKPLAFGRIRHARFFGLPGNPVSAVVTLLMLVRPALQKLAGGEVIEPLAVPARLRGSLTHRPGREEFQRGRLVIRDGMLEVSVTGDQSSNRLATFANANCLIRISKESADIEEGSVVSTLPFNGLL